MEKQVTGEEITKKHWYAVAFIHNQGGAVRYTSAFIGTAKQLVTMADIDSSKAHGGLPDDAAMMSCAYLGCATKAEMGFND